MNLEKTCKQISKDLNIDEDLVHKVVMHEFQFTKSVMQNPDDYRDILFNKLFKFKLKPRFKDNKNKNYSPYEKVDNR